MGPYAIVDYKVTLCRLQSRLQHIYHGQPYARDDLCLPLVWDLGFVLCVPGRRSLLRGTTPLRTVWQQTSSISRM
jgi:hypothetical protein